ncbi:MAG: hypothetical protein KTR21_17130 [Rhodobacteraceae bacterium]|nr:hypothetical protein [Paracoccaceae bacterium]
MSRRLAALWTAARHGLAVGGAALGGCALTAHLGAAHAADTPAPPIDSAPIAVLSGGEPFMRPAAARSLAAPPETSETLPAPLLRLFTSPQIDPTDAPPDVAPAPTPPPTARSPEVDSLTGLPINAPVAHDAKGRVRRDLRGLDPSQLSRDVAPARLPIRPRPAPLSNGSNAAEFEATPATNWRDAGPRLARRHTEPLSADAPSPDTPDLVAPVNFQALAAAPVPRQRRQQALEAAKIDPTTSPTPRTPSARVNAVRVVDPSRAALADAAAEISAATSPKPIFHRELSDGAIDAPRDHQVDAALAAHEDSVTAPSASQTSPFMTADPAREQAAPAQLIAHGPDAGPPAAGRRPPPALKGFSALLQPQQSAGETRQAAPVPVEVNY